MKLVFVWGGEKYENTCVCHPLNKKWPSTLKNHGEGVLGYKSRV
jgi:hypothetical protein